MGEGVSTDFKSSNRIEISQLVQVLLNFEWFRGSPLGGGGVGRWGWGWGGGWMWVGVVRRCTPSMCTCMHMHARTRAWTRIWHHRESPGFPQIQWGWPFAWNYHVYHACMHVHVHVWGHPPTTPHPHPPTPQPPPTPIHPPPTPKSCRKPKTPKFDNSCTNQDNSILFKDSLPLNIPELI